MGVKVANTTPYHPQSDGQAERSNHTVERMLLCYVAENQEDWDLWVTPVEYAINDSTFGRRVEAKERWRVAADKRGTAHELAKQFARQLQAARVNLQMVKQRMVEQFDARHRLQHIKVNNQVWVDGQHLTLPSDRGLKPKLRKLRHGPLRVVACLYSDRQQELPEQDRRVPSAYRQEVMAPPPVLVEGQREREVERIIGTRFRKLDRKAGGIVQEWLTKWKGLPHSHSPWRTREDLEGPGGRLEPLRVFEADEERLRRAPERRRRETHKGQEEQRAQRMAIGPPTPTVYISS
eukprot:gene10577-biopygen10819